VDASSACPPTVRVDGPFFDRSDAPLGLRRMWESEDSMATASLAPGDTSMVESSLGSNSSRRVTGLGPWMIVQPEAFEPTSGSPGLSPTDPALASVHPQESASIALTLRRAGATIIQWSAPIAVGQTSAISLGGEKLSIVDADVEVAQFAAAIDPIVAPTVDGLVASLHASHAQDGSWVVELSARVRVLAKPPAMLDAGASLQLPVQHAEHDELVANDRVILGSGPGARRAVLGMSGGLQLEIELR